MAMDSDNTVFDIIGAESDRSNTVFDLIGGEHGNSAILGHRGQPRFKGGSGEGFEHQMLGHLSEFIGAEHQMLGHLSEFVGAGADHPFFHGDDVDPEHSFFRGVDVSGDLAAAAADAGAKAASGPGGSPAPAAPAAAATTNAIVKAVQATAQTAAAASKPNGNGGGHDGQRHGDKRAHLHQNIGKEVVADFVRHGVDAAFVAKEMKGRGLPNDWLMLLGLHARMHQKSSTRALTDLVKHSKQLGKPLASVFEDLRKTLAHVFPGIHAP